MRLGSAGVALSLLAILVPSGHSDAYAEAIRLTPAIIRFAGNSLDRPLTITYKSNIPYELIGDAFARRVARNGVARNRPYFDMALYWGADWIAYVDAGRPLETLRWDLANQTGRFYPAWWAQHALVQLEPLEGIYPQGLQGTLRRATLTRLRAAGVPTEIE